MVGLLNHKGQKTYRSIRQIGTHIGYGIVTMAAPGYGGPSPLYTAKVMTVLRIV